MIIGHRDNLLRISRLVDAGQFPQVSLFYGLNGSGKKMVARQAAQALQCDSPVHKDDVLQGCGTCRQCHLMLSHSHPDYFEILPTPPKSQSKEAVSHQPVGTIKTEQVAELKQRIAYAPLMGRYQIVLIDNAELMTEVTANSLLKLLEEPRPNQIFILVTSQLHKILITIRSRCAKFFFAPLSVSQVRQILDAQAADALQSAPAGILEFYLECFPGSPTLVAEALRHPVDLQKLDRFFQGATRDFRETTAMARDVVDAGLDLKIFLQSLRGYCLQRIRRTGGAGAAELGFLDRIAEAERRLDRYIGQDFVLENLFL